MSALGGSDGEGAAAAATESSSWLAGGGGGEPEEEVDDATEASDAAPESFEAYLRQPELTVGRPRCVHTRKQKFKLALWMSDEFPLSMRDQVWLLGAGAVLCVELMKICSSRNYILESFCLLLYLFIYLYTPWTFRTYWSSISMSLSSLPPNLMSISIFPSFPPFPSPFLSTELDLFLSILPPPVSHPPNLLPLSLYPTNQQVLPIIDLLAPTSPHLAKLRDFVSMQLPAGFPVKIELPVYNVVRARVTFGNLRQGCDDPEGTLFSVPDGYRTVNPGENMDALSPEDRALMLALQASLRDQGPDDVSMSYGGGSYEDELAMQRALAESLNIGSSSGGLETDEDAQLRRALELSLAETGGGSAAAASDTEGAGQSRAGPLPAQRTRAAGHPTHDSISEEEDLQRALAASLAFAQLQDDDAMPDDEDEQLRRAMEASLAEQ